MIGCCEDGHLREDQQALYAAGVSARLGTFDRSFGACSFPVFPLFPVLERGSSSSAGPLTARSDPICAAQRLTALPGGLSHHGPDRLMADAELGGQRAQTLGYGQRADRGLLVGRELASTAAITGV